ncbi:MAG: hypothetical protein WBW16_08200 [Bacteroidota bacterium]
MLRREHKLPETYQRVLKVVAQHIETSMDDIIALVQQDEKEGITRKVGPIFSMEKREQFIHAAEAMKAKLAEFVDYFHLEKQHFREDRIMRAKVALLWEMLEDTKSDKLVGYGQIPQPLQKEIDHWVGEFLRILHDLET